MCFNKKQYKRKRSLLKSNKDIWIPLQDGAKTCNLCYLSFRLCPSQSRSCPGCNLSRIQWTLLHLSLQPWNLFQGWYLCPLQKWSNFHCQFKRWNLVNVSSNFGFLKSFSNFTKYLLFKYCTYAKLLSSKTTSTVSEWFGYFYRERLTVNCRLTELSP